MWSYDTNRTLQVVKCSGQISFVSGHKRDVLMLNGTCYKLGQMIAVVSERESMIRLVQHVRDEISLVQMKPVLQSLC